MPLAKPLVFSNVNLKWSSKHKAFYSEGKLGLSNIGRNDINGSFEGFMEIKKTEDGGPVFNVFIKASPEAWYYFGLEDNRLLVHAASSDFNSIISKRTNGGKAKIGEVAFIPGSDDETVTFINRFRRDYLGIDVPYDLTDYAAPAQTPDYQPEPVQTSPVPAQREPVNPPPADRDTQPVQDNTTPAQEDVEPTEKRDEPKQERKKKTPSERKKKTDDVGPPPTEERKKDREPPPPDDEGF